MAVEPYTIITVKGGPAGDQIVVGTAHTFTFSHNGAVAELTVTITRRAESKPGVIAITGTISRGALQGQEIYFDYWPQTHGGQGSFPDALCNKLFGRKT